MHVCMCVWVCVTVCMELVLSSRTLSFSPTTPPWISLIPPPSSPSPSDKGAAHTSPPPTNANPPPRPPSPFVESILAGRDREGKSDQSCSVREEPVSPCCVCMCVCVCVCVCGGGGVLVHSIYCQNSSF